MFFIAVPHEDPNLYVGFEEMDLKVLRAPFTCASKNETTPRVFLLGGGSKFWDPLRPKHTEYVYSNKSGGERQAINRLEEGIRSRVPGAGYIIRSLHYLERST